MKELFTKDKTYTAFLLDIKQRIQSAQIKASVSVNQELLRLYWDLGERIVEKQKQASWGDGFLSHMSKDLQREFPNIKGFSLRNLKYMRQWYVFWSGQIGQQAVAQFEGTNWQQVVANLCQLPWGHNLVILSKIENREEALFYVLKTIENNWSRAVLTHQIETKFFQREGKAVTNFAATYRMSLSHHCQVLRILKQS